MFSSKLPIEKRETIYNLLMKMKYEKQCSIREFSKLIGNLIAACPAIRYGWLYTRVFERIKTKELKKVKGNFNKTIYLPSILQNYFDW